MLDSNGVAVFSDDTQMSLFIAEGLLSAVDDGKTSGVDILPYISKAYLNWYATQTSYPKILDGSRLANIASLWYGICPNIARYLPRRQP